MFLIFMGPPFEDTIVLPSPSLMGMACGRLDRERKTCLQLNMWCEAPESITVREVERGDDRKAKDSRTREDNRVHACPCASVWCACPLVSQRGGSPVGSLFSDSSARFAFVAFRSE